MRTRASGPQRYIHMLDIEVGQAILMLNDFCARINNILCKHPSVCPLSPSSPALLRNILFPPDPPALQYIFHNIWNGNIL